VVKGFVEKPKGDGGLINGGFFVLSPEVLELITGDSTSFETGPLATLASLDHLRSYCHYGFWQPMDTLRDRNLLNDLWVNKRAPWKVW
jgi:glucose-1-phosphate cytidylyltransferase